METVFIEREAEECLAMQANPLMQLHRLCKDQSLSRWDDEVTSYCDLSGFRVSGLLWISRVQPALAWPDINNILDCQ